MTNAIRVPWEESPNPEFSRGYQARLAGYEICDNPYEDRTVYYWEWESGYKSARGWGK